jgi:branched-chain amino acid aminotransferase
MKTTEWIWHEGEIKPWAEATVHVLAHALHYGSSVFEGIRVYSTSRGPAFFRLEDHLQRLFASAKIYRMVVPWSLEAVREACHAVITKNGLGAAYVRPLLYRSHTQLGLHPNLDVPVSGMVAAVEWGPYLGREGVANGVDVCVSSWQRVAPNTIPALAKAGGNYLSSQLIAMEARRNGYAEGIALAADGTLGEGAGENLFVVREGVLLTPPSAGSILAGITRSSVIALARGLGIEVHERQIPREMLYIADEAFLCGTACEITPIRSVDRTPIGEGAPGQVTARMRDAFFGLFSGKTEDRFGWLERVER